VGLPIFDEKAIDTSCNKHVEQGGRSEEFRQRATLKQVLINGPPLLCPYTMQEEGCGRSSGNTIAGYYTIHRIG